MCVLILIRENRERERGEIWLLEGWETQRVFLAFNSQIGEREGEMFSL